LQQYFIFFLRYNKTIRSLVAGFLLFIFAFSNTPKSFLHEAFATHKDSVSSCTSKTGYCIHQESYNCHFDNLVVTTAYVIAVSQPAIDIVVSLKAHYCSLSPSPYTVPVCGRENKGPPSIA